MPRAAVLRPVSLKEANQQFSRLIREVEAGEGFVVTRRGRPVARIVPHDEDRTRDPAWVRARDELMALLETGVPLGGVRMENRDELHDRDGRIWRELERRPR